MTEDQNKPVHTIVEEVLDMALQGSDELVVFPDDIVKQIQNMLREIFGTRDLIKAMIELLKLAAVLDDKGCKDAALKLIKAAVSCADGLKPSERNRLFKDDYFEHHKSH